MNDLKLIVGGCFPGAHSPARVQGAVGGRPAPVMQSREPLRPQSQYHETNPGQQQPRPAGVRREGRAGGAYERGEWEGPAPRMLWGHSPRTRLAVQIRSQLELTDGLSPLGDQSPLDA